MVASGYGLALHTCTPQLGLALGSWDEESGDHPVERRSHLLDLGRSLGNELHSSLQEFLQPQGWSELAWIAVARGPGGFTGTRMGMATARTLAQQLALPLYALSSLAAIAQQQAEQQTLWGQPLAVIMPAQRGQYAVGCYCCTREGLPTVLLPDQVMSIEAWQQWVEDWSNHPAVEHLAVEHGGSLHIWHESSAGAASVTALLHLAHEHWRQGDRPHWSAALPFYGQHPVALACT